MVTARVLLDTGPTPAEAARIRAAFHARGMTATVEGHSYGGPPPTSAFLIVVNTRLPVFLARFTGADLEELVTSLLALRADPAQWGRRHVVKLEDADSGLGVLCDAEVPPRAYAALLTLDLAHFDRDSPPLRVEWSPALGLWRARLIDLPRDAMVRVPRLAESGADPALLRTLDEAEKSALWRLVDPGADSAISRRRAGIVLASAVGWSAASVARRTAVREALVRAVIRDFNDAGFAALEPGFEAARPAQTAGEREDALAAARHGAAGWTPETLAEFLVAEGLVEDITPTAAKELMTDAHR
ncbi:COG3415 family protein [Sphaerisporangium aureirubrum]|uniref:Helix-turn-helix domain-containing protein n=1 Tax=Sphaerisporangium aureirubrum TaxID=1544736 RepID=A0ABW1NAS9_9ACTN